MAQKKDIKLDLRSEPDVITKSIGKFSLICWILTFTAIVVACLAMPTVRNFLSTSFSLNLKPAWSKILYHIDFYILTVIFVISGLGLFLNSIRHRRRTDKYDPSLVYFLILSALCMIGYLIFFQKIL
ncbi:MAG TPA: hypothetical protein DDW50_07595 [Firmicutes bacterium]|nr:hypothetical protein [Bacillota bacterium]